MAYFLTSSVSASIDIKSFDSTGSIVVKTITTDNCAINLDKIICLSKGVAPFPDVNPPIQKPALFFEHNGEKHSWIYNNTSSRDNDFDFVKTINTNATTTISGSLTDTGSLLTTASAVSNTITFTKGDGSTFPITVSGGGSSFPFTGSAGISGSLTIDNLSEDPVLTLQTTSGSSNAGPVALFQRFSPTVDSGDYLGQLKFQGYNDASASKTYAKISAKTSNVTATDEDGVIEFMVRADGSEEIPIRINKNGLYININNDIRFEGTTADPNETTINVADPQQDNTITFPDASGNVLLDTSIVSASYVNITSSRSRINFNDPSVYLTSVGDGVGDIVTYGAGTVRTGEVYFLSGSNEWIHTSATNGTNGSECSSSLLAIALGNNVSDGMLLRGHVRVKQTTGGSNGYALYVSTTDGTITTTIPSASSNINRVVGHNVDTGSSLIHFAPSPTWTIVP